MATASPRSGVLRTFSEKIFRSPRSGKGRSRKDDRENGRTGFNLDRISLNSMPKFGSANAKVVVAIDFGTTYSGYAYAFTSAPDEIHLMRKVGPGQFGSVAHKNPTILLLDDKGRFHSFGFDAREAYHDLEEEESRNWLYFEKFKMELHSRRVSRQMKAILVREVSLSWNRSILHVYVFK